MSYTSYAIINNLEEYSFIAGTDTELEFTVVDENGDSIDISGATTISWSMGYYGRTDAVITKTLAGGGIVVSPSDVFTVTIPGTDTESLYGHFYHQPTVVDYTGKTFIPKQGILVIGKKIG